MAGIYHNATLGVISLSSDGESWITIADKNLGATQVYNDGDTLSEANCGKFYQWGNNYGFPFRGPTTTSSTQVDVSNYGPGNYYSNSTYIMYYDIYTTDAPNLWGAVTGTNEAMQGPCDSGYHIPTSTELSNIRELLVTTRGLSDNITTAKTYLKMPPAGNINNVGVPKNQGTSASWFTADKYSGVKDRAYDFRSSDSYLEIDDNSKVGIGNSIRPFKNVPVKPDPTWTKLYGDDIIIPKLKRIVKHNNYYYFGDAPVHASGITLNKNSITLNNAGDTEQLTATVTPDDAVNKKVIWSSSDTSIATVSSTGLVTCVTPGECTITATCADNGISTSCDVSDMIYIDFLLVGGGGGGGFVYGSIGGGGGAGGVICCQQYGLQSDNIGVVIGEGGGMIQGLSNGGDSCFGEVIAYGGGSGGGNAQSCSWCGQNGGSGGGGGIYGCNGGLGTTGQGNNGGKGYCNGYGSGGGGGAGGAGCAGQSYIGGDGGIGIESDISGECCWYAGGGGGGSGNCCCSCGGCGGGGVGGVCRGSGGFATYYGGGGGGAGCNTNGGRGGKGYQGVFIARYPTTSGYELYGGCKYTCGDYTIHCFTKSGALSTTPVTTVDFLLVAGGGGGGSAFGGGGGAGGLIQGTDCELPKGDYCVIIGQGGAMDNNGGDSCFGNKKVCGGGAGGQQCKKGNDGGSGGGAGYQCPLYGYSVQGQGCNGGSGYSQGLGSGGGGGICGKGCSATSSYCGGLGGDGVESDIDGTSKWYSGGGTGFTGYGYATGGNGKGGAASGCGTESNACCYGGGGGGAYTQNGKGGPGVFILRYLTACGYDVTGGCKYTCGDYTIHCFTSDGTLTVN